MSRKINDADLAVRIPAGRRLRMGLGVLLVAALLLPGPAPEATEDGAPDASRFQGEELYYSIEFFGTEMARGALVMGRLEDREGGAVLPVYGLAVTEGVAALVYPMRDEGSASIDPATGLSRTTFKELDEQGEYRSYRVDFYPRDYKAEVTRVRRGATNRYERILPSRTHDAFSWAYAIREQPLIPGATQVYFVYDGWKLSRVTATVAEGEDHILVGDEFVRCRRINLYREVMDSMRPVPMIQESADLPPALWVRETRSGEQIGDLWISLDERRLPVQIVFSNNLISLTARLVEYREPIRGY